MKPYTTISGHTIELDSPDDVAAFIERLQTLGAKPKTTENELVALVYGVDNPLMDKNAIPGRGAVTQRVLEDPAYRVMTDILFRKHVADNRIDVEQLAAQYTMSPQEAAERLGVHVSTVRQAIDSGRLGSWMKDGRHFINPTSLASFKLSPRGPKPPAGQVRSSTEPLRVHVGSHDGYTLHVKNAGITLEPAKPRKPGEVGRTGLIGPWRRVGVFTGAGENARFFVLEPGDEENVLEFGPFSIRGKFKIVEKINNARKASETFKAFVPA